jgi:hypothetical protein
MTSIALYSAQPILAEGFRDVVGGIEGFALLSVYTSPDLPINRIQGIGCPDVLVVDVGLVTGALTPGGLIRLRSAAGTAAIALRIESVAPEYAAQVLERGFEVLSLEPHRLNLTASACAGLPRVSFGFRTRSAVSCCASKRPDSRRGSGS